MRPTQLCYLCGAYPGDPCLKDGDCPFGPPPRNAYRALRRRVALGLYRGACAGDPCDA